MSTTAQAQKAKHKAKAPRHHSGKSPSPEKVTQSLVAAVVDQVAAVFTPEK